MSAPTAIVREFERAVAADGAVTIEPGLIEVTGASRVLNRRPAPGVGEAEGSPSISGDAPACRPPRGPALPRPLPSTTFNDKMPRIARRGERDHPPTTVDEEPAEQVVPADGLSPPQSRIESPKG